MRYETTRSLGDHNSRLSDDLKRQNLALRRCIFVLAKKHLTAAEEKTVMLALDAAGMEATALAEIRAGEREWPR